MHVPGGDRSEIFGHQLRGDQMMLRVEVDVVVDVMLRCLLEAHNLFEGAASSMAKYAGVAIERACAYRYCMCGAPSGGENGLMQMQYLHRHNVWSGLVPCRCSLQLPTRCKSSVFPCCFLCDLELSSSRCTLYA